jgi:uncharacterized protein YecE (DUF72 family)
MLPCLVRVGCAGWSLRKELIDLFPARGTHLERYAGRFNCVEINSSFYKPHRAATYQRWAASTPDDFRFAVKLPKQITHVQRLVDAEPLLEKFAAEVQGLGAKQGPVLVQLPPSLTFDEGRVACFARQLRNWLPGTVVWEPRHLTWFTPEAESLLMEQEFSRVAADPSVASSAGRPGGSLQCVYFRWHGSPRMYYSNYEAAALQQLANDIAEAAQTAAQIWCIFDNTAEGAAINNALELATSLTHSEFLVPHADRY